jgi:hypothetical protein
LLSVSEAKYSLTTDIAEIEVERRAIIETAKSNSTWLKVNNGKPTNPTPEQRVDAEEIYNNIGVVKNIIDGREVDFVY